jgi:hypothetical protein
MARNDYAQRAFINCPFDSEYKPLFEAIAFAVLACGIRPRCALEIDDSSEVRIDKIFKIIAECKYGIHDISRTEVTSASGLPRFNMPLELGNFVTPFLEPTNLLQPRPWVFQARIVSCGLLLGSLEC